MYKAFFHPQVKKDLKKFDKSLLPKIKALIENILLISPQSGESLKGEFQGIYSYHFKTKQGEYRIAYSVFSSKNEIFIYMIAKRENFYKRLKSRSN